MSFGDLRSLGLLSTPRRQELVVPLAIDGVSRIERVDILQERLVLWRLLPHPRKLLRGVRDAVFVSRPRFSFGRRSQRGQEIGHGLLRGAVKAHVEEELFRFVAFAEKDLVTFIQHTHLVKDVVG